MKRQSSSCCVGKPWSAKLAMPALRNGASHFGCDDVDSSCENFPTNNSVPLFAFCVIVNFLSNEQFSMQSTFVQVWSALVFGCEAGILSS